MNDHRLGPSLAFVGAVSLISAGCSSDPSTGVSGSSIAAASIGAQPAKTNDAAPRPSGSSSGAPAPSGSGAPSAGGPAQRTVAAFNEVHVATSIEADIDIGPSGPLEITGDEEDVAAVKTEVSGGVLTIGFPSGGHSMRKPLVVHMTAPKITALVASTSGIIKAAGLASDDLAVQADTSAHVTLSGKCKKLDAKAMTSGNLDAGGLACEDVKVEAATSGSLTVNASSSATGTAATSAHVHVVGNPKIKKIDTATSASVD